MNIKDNVKHVTITHSVEDAYFTMLIKHNGNGVIGLEGDSVILLQKPEVLAAVILEASTKTTPERDKADWIKSLKATAETYMLDTRFIYLVSCISAAIAIEWAEKILTNKNTGGHNDTSSLDGQ